MGFRLPARLTPPCSQVSPSRHVATLEARSGRLLVFAPLTSLERPPTLQRLAEFAGVVAAAWAPTSPGDADGRTRLRVSPGATCR